MITDELKEEIKAGIELTARAASKTPFAIIATLQCRCIKDKDTKLFVMLSEIYKEFITEYARKITK